METGNNAVCELLLYVHYKTKNAICVSETGERNKAVWLPVSQVDISELRGGGPNDYVVVLPQWLAYEKGLI